MTLATSLEELRLLTLTNMSSIEAKSGLQGPRPFRIRWGPSSTQNQTFQLA
jgi:hypothetical protein